MKLEGVSMFCEYCNTYFLPSDLWKHQTQRCTTAGKTLEAVIKYNEQAIAKAEGREK